MRQPQKNFSTSKYEVAEEGRTYSMDLEGTRLIIKYQGYPMKAKDWYLSMSGEDRKQITVSPPFTSGDQFYADQEWD